MYHQKEIDIRKFEKCKRICRYSFVYKVQNKETGDFYTAKIFDCGDDICSHKTINQKIPEIMRINHPTILPYHWFSMSDLQDEANLVMIMGFATKGSFSDLLQNLERNEIPANYTNTTRQKMIIGISRGMKYLHDHNFYHCNLKSSNILLDDEFQPYISDFFKYDLSNINGLSAQLENIESLIYKAPEIFTNNKYHEKSDVYSFGIVIYEIINDLKAFTEKVPDFELKNKIVNEKYRPKFNKKINASLHQLIEQCWSDEPNKRPTFDEIFKKLSNKNYFLENVDEQEINSYVEKISKIYNDPIDMLTKIEPENLLIDEILNGIKEDNNNKITKISQIKEDCDQIIRSNNELKAKNIEHFDKLREIKDNFTKIRKDIDDLKTQNKQQNNQLDKIEEFHQQLQTELNNYKPLKIPIKENEDENEFIQSGEFYKDGIIYKLDITHRISNISFSSYRKSDFFVPRSVFFQSIEYVIKGIVPPKNRNDSTNKLSIIFSEESEIKCIDFDDFSCSRLYSISIPPCVEKISISNYKCVQYLYKIKISPNNQNFKWEENLLLGKSNSKTDKFDIIVFANRNIEHAKIPLEIQTIGSSSFSYCEKLQSIEIPNDSKLISIGDHAFSHSSISTIKIPCEVETIGSYSFSSCDKLQNIEIPDDSKLISIGDHAFYGSSISTIKIPCEVETIGSYSFYNCQNLQSIEIPNDSKLISIGDHAFEYSTISTIKIPREVETIGSFSFFKCLQLQSIEIPDDSKLISIGDHTFSHSSISTIKIPREVETIGSYSFSSCEKLQNIEIPNDSKLISIGDHAFHVSEISTFKIPPRVRTLLKM